VRTDRLAREWNVELVHVQFPLHPSTPDEGQALADLFRGRGYDLDRMYAQMKERMDAEGLEYPKRTHTYNSRRAQELAKLAEKQGRNEIHHALYRAYFVEGKNLADVEALVDVAKKIGLDGDEARRVIEERQMADAVDADWAHARALGVTGVPTYVANGYGVVGAQPYEVLVALVQKAGATKKS